ncbi:MAG: HD domain-containing phosphohydrolase [Desulfonatronovibrio sp.]
MQNSEISSALNRLGEILFQKDCRTVWEEKVTEADLRKLFGQLEQHMQDQLILFHRLTAIGLSLSREKNISDLLEKILTSARELTNADAGTLYLLDQDEKNLSFEIVQNATLKLSLRKDRSAMGKFFAVPLEKEGFSNIQNVSSYVALSGKKVNIPDVYSAEGFDFSGTRQYDQKSGYRSESMLVIPMQNHEDKIIGVLQIINAIDPATGDIISFSSEHEEIVGALASQAAIALTKTQLIQDLETLLNSFIKSIAIAIDGKSAHTGRHVDRVVELVLLLAGAVSSDNRGPFKKITFSPEEMDELRIASWLHDVGKIATPEYVLDKQTRLEKIWDREELIRSRFALISLSMENEYLKAFAGNSGEKKHEDWSQELEKRQADLKQDLEFVIHCNRTGQFINDEMLARLRDIASRTFVFEGEEKPYLTSQELSLLSIRKGNLSPEDRQAIENHAAVTRKILEPLPFPRKLSRVPDYAAMHHERMDGSGYPQGLSEESLPLQARIIAVADVFEALTARDRPYKKPIPLDKALEILTFMKKDRHLDPDLVDFFIKEKIYQVYADKYLGSSTQ